MDRIAAGAGDRRRRQLAVPLGKGGSRALSRHGGDFTLQSADGPVSLSDFRGKVVLIYFGYTSCPDVCPTSLGALSAALKQLSPREMDRVQPIFISVDPERDTPGKMVEYVHYFHPKMIGVTGSIEQVRKVADRYGAYFRKAEVKDSSSVMPWITPR